MKRTRQKVSGIDLNKTLQQLEKNYWPAYQYESSLIEKCHAYRKIRLLDLTAEHLRLLIGQNIGNNYLIPLAMDKLTEDVLIEGDYYDGDLLFAVVSSDKNYWTSNKTEYNRMIAILNDNFDTIKNLQTTKDIKKKLMESIESFKIL